MVKVQSSTVKVQYCTETFFWRLLYNKSTHITIRIQLKTENVKPGEVLMKALDKLYLLLSLGRIHVFSHVNNTAIELKGQSVKYDMLENENLVERISEKRNNHFYWVFFLLNKACIQMSLMKIAGDAIFFILFNLLIFSEKNDYQS